MSKDKFKQHAKRLHTLLSERFHGARDPLKLSETQEYLARAMGYSSFDVAQRELQRAEKASGDPLASSAKNITDAWAVRRDCIDPKGTPTRDADLRVVTGAGNAFSLLWLWANNHFKERSDPPLPGTLTMKRIACAEPGQRAGEALEIRFAWHDVRVRLQLYPLDELALMVGERVAVPVDEVAAILADCGVGNDVAVMERASASVFESLQRDAEEFHATRPGRAVLAGLQQHLEEVARKAAETAEPSALIYDVATWHVGKWRLQLLYLNGNFHFDAFREQTGTFTFPVEWTCLKLSKSGKWTAEANRGQTAAYALEPVVLEGLKRTDLDAITEVVRGTGVSLIVEGVVQPATEVPTPQMHEFMSWAATNEPTLKFPL